MAKSEYLTTIAIDTERSTFHFYSMIGNDRSTIAHHIKNYAGGHFDDDFFKKFKEAVKEFTANTPSESVRKITVVLPDSVVLADTIKVPTMRGLGQTKKTLDITLGGLYRNYNELQVVSHVAEQNKQYSTFAISAVQKRIVTSIYAACSENKLLVDTLTFASSAAIGGATMINPKLKNGSYLFLDLKDTYARFVFVANGKTVGFYTLPFGLEFLRKDKVTQEDMLFDHSYAELSVLNARERAKSKKLTIMALDTDTDEADEDIELEDEPLEVQADENAVDEESVEEEAEDTEEMEETDNTIPVRPQPSLKLFTRKSPRKLPKFMQREIPETSEGILYENFRVFVKWALTLIHSNEKLTELGKPAFVCVNIPSDLEGVLEMVNAEAEENGITFTHLPYESTDTVVSANLELFGGLFPKQISSTSKF